MRTKAANELHDYWMRLREDGRIPSRRDIEPGEIRSILPDLFILEHSNDANPRFRLAGTRVCALFGRELRGSGFDRLWLPDIGNQLARVAVNVMARSMPAIIRASAHDACAERSDVEIVMFPLASHGRIADRIIGSLAPLAMRRHTEAAFRHMTLDKLGMIDPVVESSLSARRGPAEIPVSVMAMRPYGLADTVRRVLHLRIFEGGRSD